MMTKPNFARATTLAYEELFRCDCRAFPLRPQEMRFPGITYFSMREYHQRTGVPLQALTQDGEFQDGYTFRRQPGGQHIILFDDAQFAPHDNHTLLHEVGHIRLGHTDQSPAAEVEAHFFASQMLAPDVILYELIRRGVLITVDLQIVLFGLSRTAATKNLDHLDRHRDPHPNENDALVLALFRDFLDRHFPDRAAQAGGMDEDRYYDALLQKWEGS